MAVMFCTVPPPHQVSMPRFSTALLAAVFAAVLTLNAGAQPVAGFTVDFEDGDTQGFGVGGAGQQPTVVDDGSGNQVLQNISVGGAGPNSAQLIQNETDAFTGDFLSAGITGISASVRVDPTSDGPLFLRLSFTNDFSAMGANGTGFSSTEAQVVQSDCGHALALG